MHFIIFTISLAFAAGNTDFMDISNIGQLANTLDLPNTLFGILRAPLDIVPSLLVEKKHYFRQEPYTPAMNRVQNAGRAYPNTFGYDSRVPQQHSMDQDYAPQAEASVAPAFYGATDNIPTPNNGITALPATRPSYSNFPSGIPPMPWDVRHTSTREVPQQSHELQDYTPPKSSETIGNFPQPNEEVTRKPATIRTSARIPPSLWSVPNVLQQPRPSQGYIPPETRGTWGNIPQPENEITGMPANNRRHLNTPVGKPPMTWSVDHTSSREIPQHARELQDYTPSGPNRFPGNVPQRKDEITKKSNTIRTPSRTPPMLWNQPNATQQPRPRQQEPLGNFPQPNNGITGISPTKQRYPNIPIPRGLQDYTPPSKATGNIPQSKDDLTRKPDTTSTPGHIPPNLWSVPNVIQQPRRTQGYIPPGSYEATYNIALTSNDVDIIPRPLRADNTSYKRVPQQSRVAQEITTPRSSGASSSIHHPKQDVQLIPAATGIYSTPLIAIRPR